MSSAASGAAGVYRRLLGHVRPFLAFLLASFAGFGVYAGSQVAFTELLGLTVDTVRAFADGEDTSRARTLIPLAMVAAVGARGLGAFAGQYCLARVSHGVVHRLRTQLFDGLLTLPVGWIERSARGHLVSRLTYTVAQVTGAASKALEVIAREGLTVLALTGWMLWMNWRLTLVFLLVAPLIAAVVVFASRRFRRIARRIQSAMGDVTQRASEAVAGHREVRIYGGEEAERARFAAASAHNMRQDVRMAATRATSTPVIQLLVATALALLVWLVLDPVFLAGMSGGDVVAFITAAGLLAKPIRQLSQVNAVVQRGLAAAEDVFAQLDVNPEVDAGAHAPERVAGDVVFEAVSFAYADGAEVLSGVDLRVPAGRTVAVVGRSGSGKSTLASLLPRFHEPTAGTIRLDGLPLAEYTLAALRRQIAYVGQDAVLFDDTVGRNIAFGALAGASEEAIREAARRAHALEFIDALPEGMDTRIGDDGVLLSGGQRQRLAIARAFLKDAPVLILDEATSALDAESEGRIQAALEEVMVGRSTLVIAHRLSTIEHADEIVVLDAGRIVERGRHADLLAAGGAYASLHRRQYEARRAPGEEGADEGTAPPAAAPEARRQPAGAGLEQRVLEHWYSDSRVGDVLAPLGAVTGLVARWRRDRASAGGDVWRAPVPVLVVGNLTVGGTGKTPFVIWFAHWLGARGWRPGIVARGHGGTPESWPVAVGPESTADEVGDEALLLQRESGCPVYVAPERPLAGRALLAAHPEVDVLLSDDGLQHHALARDAEIVLIDGVRGLGNGRCLPAGPLREPPERLDSVDLLVSNGALRAPECDRPHERFDLVPGRLRRLVDDATVAPAALTAAGPVHAVAGIGHPERFFATLESLGVSFTPHPLDDHAPLPPERLAFGDEAPIVCTEKDAVRLERWLRAPEHAALAARCHALAVELEATDSLERALTRLVAALAAAGTLEVK